MCFLYNLCLITVLSHLVMGTTGSGSILEESIEQFDSVAIKQCLAKCGMYGFCDFIVYDSEHLRCDLLHDGSIPPSSSGSLLRTTDQVRSDMQLMWWQVGVILIEGTICMYRNQYVHDTISLGDVASKTLSIVLGYHGEIIHIVF